MTNCFGEDNYYGWSKMVFKAVKECYGEETVLPTHGAPDMEEEVGSFDIPGIRGGYDVKRGCLYI